jgi:transposase-like protein
MRWPNGYPNPVSTGCIIPLLLQKRQSVQLELFNARGEKVKTLLSGEVGEGTHDVVVTTGDLTSGMYCYTIRMANGVKQTRIMQILNEKR